jgi:pimeloyl-ACP methyl ester carboxylesterase
MNRRLVVIQAGVVLAVLAVIAACATIEPSTPAIQDKSGNVVPGSINVIETVVLGGVPQVITIRGEDTAKPVLLHLHGGPGIPSSPWASWNDYYADLEKNFVLVHWDQRGAGKSYSNELTADDMHMANFVNDALELADLLRKRFNQEKIFLWGHSWGSGLGFETITKSSEPFYAFFASAVRPEWDASQQLSYEKTLKLARQKNDEKAIKVLTDIQPFDPVSREHLGVLGELRSQYLVNDFHTEGLESAWYDYVLKGDSPEYPKSTVKQTMRGIRFTNVTISAEILSSGYNLMRDFPESDIPVFFLAGRYDYVTPGELAKEYFEMLEAPMKDFIWFENSAHDVNYDEPDKFGRTLTEIANEVLDR